MKPLTVGLLILVCATLAGCGIRVNISQRNAPETPTETVATAAIITSTLPSIASVTERVTVQPSITATTPLTSTVITSPTMATATQTTVVTATAASLPVAPPTLPPATPSRKTTAKPTSAPSPTPTPTAPMVQVRSLYAAPGEPGRLYACVSDSISYYDRNLVSDDFGATWRPFEGGPYCLMGMDYASGTPYALTNEGLSRWTGSEWQLVTKEPLWKVAMIYDDPQKLWAIGPISVIHSPDGGETWQTKGSNGYAFDIATDPQDANQIYGIFNTWGQYNLARSTGNGQWSALPIEETYGRTNVTWRGMPGMTIDGASNSLYIAIGNRNTSSDPAGSQIWRTTNANAMTLDDVKWTLVHDFGPSTQLQLLASGWNPENKGPTLYANLRPEPCPPDGGICTDTYWVLHRSLDRGATWEPITLAP